MKTKTVPSEIITQELERIGKQNPSDEREIHTFQCRLVTPLFGGGVKAGEVDTKMPVRATAIRGQLRFWWRFLKQHDPVNPVKDPKELFKQERAIWGGLGDKNELTASKVLLRVQTSGPIGLERRAETLTRWIHRCEGYVLFPAFDRESGINPPPPRSLGRPFEFSLNIGLQRGKKNGLSEEQCSEVLTALKWWATFGGLGARTRRGVGTVLVKNISNQVLTVSKEEAQKYGCKLVLAQSSKQNPIDAWHDAITKLQMFRQGRDIGRNRPAADSKSPAGRSRWPEPDAIRRITKQNSRRHQPVHKAGNVFPRAAFGMPIISHFKDKGDPADTPQLLPLGYERMSSPLILRAYYLGNSSWVAACLCFPYHEILKTKIELKQGDRSWALGELWQTDQCLSKEIPPMANRGQDPISAFLKFFEEGN